jgi:hypothetical protein
MRAHHPTPRRHSTPRPSTPSPRRHPAARPTATAALVAAALTALLAAPTPAHAAAPGHTAPGHAASARSAAAENGIPALPGVPADATGLQGPVVTHPGSASFDYPAGEVCAFPSHTDFPVSDLTTRTWTDAAGNPVFAVETGPLLMKVTNLDTGESVTRDISGTGVITYPDYPSADTYVLSGNDWSAAFHTADRPAHNTWIVASTFMSVKVSTADGKVTRQLLGLSGPYEDLCKTLA